MTADPRVVAVAGARRRRPAPAAESGVQCTVGGEFAAILGGLGLVGHRPQSLDHLSVETY
jgi:hypothetical protein